MVIRVVTVPHARDDLTAVLPADVVGVPTSGGPARWLDPWHVAAHADEVDVVHLHVGHEHLHAVGSLQQTRAWAETWTAALRRAGVPLVVTVHDLREPDDDTRERYDVLLAGLMDTAEVLLTLTAGAADELADRHGRTAIAVGHPAQVVRVAGVDRETRLVGVHLGSLAANLLDPVPVVRAALSGAVSGGGRLQVDVHPDVRVDEVLPEIQALAAAGELELCVHPPFTAQQRIAYLQHLHVSVLPHRFGTDAAWLEACRDLGTRVVGPTSGHYQELWSDVVEYANEEDGGLEATSLMMAVVAALTRPVPERPDPSWRAEQRLAVQRVHGAVYDRVVADRVAAQIRP